MSVKGKKRKRCRKMLLAILEKNGCVMYVEDLLEQLTKIYGERKKAYVCLRDTRKSKIVRVEDNKVYYDKCIHKNEVIKGVDLLSFTLDRLEDMRFKNRCEEYKEHLYQKFDIIVLDEARRLLSIALEHIITSLRSNIRLDEEELRRLTLNVRYEVKNLGKEVEGCCRECLEKGICKDIAINNELIKKAEEIVYWLLDGICPEPLKPKVY
jgi:hypothetical protein